MSGSRSGRLNLDVSCQGQRPADRPRNVAAGVRAVLLALLVAGAAEAGQSAADPLPATAAPAAAAMPFAFEGPPPPVPPEVISRDADGRATIRAVRLTSPLRIDGTLDEPLYTTVPPISDFVQVEPDLGAPASERTDVWLAYDRNNVYLAFRVWDSQPERRVATDMRRDGNVIFQSDDVVNFFLDTFYDRRNGVSFTINSIGARNDGQQINDQYNRDWNPIWDFAVGRFDGGWTLEVALPFRSLRYRPGQAQIWGFNVLRTVRWKNELSVMVPVPQGLGMSSAQHAQLAATVVGLEAPPTSMNLDVKPYAVGSLTSDAGALPPVSNRVGRDIGLDVKYGLTENLVADFTYNTDFAQVEADEQQVNLTRFSLFFPEKREFFLENQGLFTFGGGGGNTPVLFYSRRIGLEEGRVVPIQAGGRLTGRIGRYSLGALNIRTGESPASGSRATNFSVLRLRRDVLRRSTVGALFTGRSVGLGGAGANTAMGVDAAFNFYNYLSLNAYAARTRTDGLRGDDTSYRAQLDYAGDRYGLQLDRLRVGAHFNPEVGFVRRDDIGRTYGQIRFSPRPRSIRSVRRFVWAGSINYIETGAGRLDTRERSGEFAVELESGHRFAASYTGTHEFVPRPFRIAPNVTLPVGGYSYDTVRVGFNFSPQQRVSANLAVERGTFYSGHRTALSVSRGRLNLSPRLSVEPTYSVNQVDLAEGSFTTHLAGTRVIYTMSPRMFASSLIQYHSGNNIVTANVRLRWEYRPGSELFIVYNDERDTRARGFPELSTRAFIVKGSRLLRF